MKLKTRIIVGFVAIILLPLLLFSASLYGFSQTQAKHVQESSSQASDSSQMVYDISLPQSSSSQVKLMAKDMILTATIILVFTALSVGLWIYRSIAVPLVKLKKATKNIKEGNLDFVLEVEGNDEFSQLCQDFEEMRKRLKESTEEKILMDKENKELISNISHDLKTPITAVKGYVEGIMDGVADTPEKMDRYVRTIYNKTNEMDHLINELTFYSKIDTNRIPYTFSKLNVEDYFSDCAEELGLEMETRGIELVYANYVEKGVQVIADGEQIRRVIHNIVSNAIKYMEKPRGIIQLRVKDVGDFIQVEIENRGDTGLVRAMKEEFDLIILDLMLPEVDGFDICRQVREEKNTPIIMVSAKKDDIDKIRGLGLGADDYMTKPFSPSELVARVKAHMERYNRLVGSNVHKNDVIEIRGIKIDKTARRVWVNGEETTFTTKEFDLLTFLAENPNRVFTKEELFREIWDMESVGDIATVTVHIKKIREKIEFNTAKPQYIETIWGVGYRFKV